MRNYFKYIAILALGIVSCEPELDNPIDEAGFYTNGEADFSNYVALGNSLTAGYADGALYITGQENSYPNIMAQQFSLVQETGVFTQPLMADNAGGLLAGGTQIPGFNNRRVLAVGTSGPSPQIYTGMAPTTDITNVLSGSFNNMGVPGAKSFHLLAPGYGNLAGVSVGTANPYFVRFASSAQTSILADAVAQNPTFFSLFIGNNDVLSYATSGGVGEDQTGNPDPSSYGPNDITDPLVFGSVYSQIVTAMVGTGAGGVLMNIPDVTSIPFFTTVTFNPLTKALLGSGDEATGTATINALNTQLYGPLNQALTAFGAGERINLLSTTAASNPLLIKDESLTDLSAQLTAAFTPSLGVATATFYGNVFGQARQAKASDLVLLTTSSVIGTAPEGIPAPLDKFGITYPLQDEHVLIPTEIQAIAVATTAYNVSIEALADSGTNGLAFVDINAFLTRVANGGIPFDAGTLTSQFVTGGAFSLDGVHPTPRGYAAIANLILDAVNDKYSSTVPKVNIGNYGTVTLSNEVQ
jgi:lysophospholipase L1-like esterase